MTNFQHPVTLTIENAAIYVALDALETLRAEIAERTQDPWNCYGGALGTPEFYAACIEHAYSVMFNALDRSPVKELPSEQEAYERWAES